MKYIRILVLMSAWIFLLSEMALGQRFAEDYWHVGTVRLEEGETLSGNLKFSLQNELVQLDAPSGLQTLTARNVVAFNFFDRAEQRERYYYALPFAKVSDYPTPTFFELIHQSEPITLLCREIMTVQTMVVNNPYTLNPGIPVARNILKNEFYFLYKNGKVVSFNGTKKGILYLLRDRERDIKIYLKENRVNFDSKADMMRLIEYYNSKRK